MMHVAKLSLSQKAREPKPESQSQSQNTLHLELIKYMFGKEKNCNVRERLAKIYDNYFQVSGGLACVKKLKKHQ